jgi:hypothetical protein
MEEAINRFARELAEAIAAAVAHDPRVEACRQRARAGGFEMRVSLEAVVGFVKSTAEAAGAAPEGSEAPVPVHPFEVSASDRRFLRSLRIAADETREEV